MVLPSSHSPNGTQSVAGNEGGSVRPTVGVKLPWRQFAADRLATSLALLHIRISGCRGQIENAFYHKARCKVVYEIEACLCSPDLKYFLVSGGYIGRTYLPKFQIGGQTLWTEL